MLLQYYLIILYFIILHSLFTIFIYLSTNHSIFTFHDKILLLIAHPDDESMFYIPTIKHVENKSNFFILCLSNGNINKIGYQREEELKNALSYLGCHNQNLKIVIDKRLKDHLDYYWNANVINEYVIKFVDRHKINIIITFDEKGISNHPNHISLFFAIQKLKKYDKNIKAYALKTVNIIRKYISFFDIILSCYNPFAIKIFLCNPFLNYRAMRCHKSQFVWFRKLFVLFSRYTWINDFKEIY